MPSDLRLVLLLVGLAALSAPVSVAVIHEQDVAAAKTNAEAMTGGDADRGKAAIERRGCGGCHEITGVSSAVGQVGPSLSGMAGRALIAGKLANSPDQMVLWLQHPQAVVPGNGMPEMGIGPQEARDIAAYLYTLRKVST